MSMSTGSRETLASALAAGAAGSYVSCAKFCGRSGYATVRVRGTFGGATVTLMTAEDSSGTGEATLTGFSLTAGGSSVVHVSYLDFIKVAVSGGDITTAITATASPHDRL